MGLLDKKPLIEMDEAELKSICTKLKIKTATNDTLKTLITRIEESGKYVTTKETGAGPISTDDNGDRVHKTLGKYIKVKVHPTAAAQKNTSIFVSINLYTAEFQPNETVSLPKQVIKFLKSSGIVEHYYDPTAMTDNGNIGAHLSRIIPKYIIEVVGELDD